jgi:hypothetical protein
MYTSNYEVIDTLIRLQVHNMSDTFGSPEEWLQQKLDEDCRTAYGDFTQEHSLDDYEGLDELRDAFDSYKDSWLEEAWETMDDEVEAEVNAVWENVTDYMDAEDKFSAVQKLV